MEYFDARWAWTYRKQAHGCHWQSGVSAPRTLSSTTALLQARLDPILTLTHASQAQQPSNSTCGFPDCPADACWAGWVAAALCAAPATEGAGCCLTGATC